MCLEGVWGLLGWLWIMPGGLSCQINWQYAIERILFFICWFLFSQWPWIGHGVPYIAMSVGCLWSHFTEVSWAIGVTLVTFWGGVGMCVCGGGGEGVKLIDNKNLIRVILISWFLLSQLPQNVWRLSGMCLSGAWWLSEWIWILSGGYGVQAIDKHPIRHFLLVCSFFPLVALDWSKCAIFWGVWRVSGRCLGGVWGMSEWLWIMPGGIWVECN